MRRLITLALWLAAAALLQSCAGSRPTTQEVREQLPQNNDPADPERRARARLDLAAAYFSRGQSATALDELKIAIAAKPDLPEAYSLRGLVYASLGDPRQAEQSFQRALQLKTNDADTLHNYGWFLCQERRYPDAEAQFERALSVPQYRDGPRTLLAQGVCQARAGRWPDAEKTLMRSFELDASNPTTAYNLSEVLYRKGELERARFYVRRVNSVPELSSAQSLWLAARIEQRSGNSGAAQEFGRQLRNRFPQSPETLQLERGRFDD